MLDHAAPRFKIEDSDNITGTFNNRKLEERFIERPTPSSTTQDSCEPSRLEENDATYHSTNKTRIVTRESFISRVVTTKDFLSLFVFDKFRF